MPCRWNLPQAIINVRNTTIGILQTSPLLKDDAFIARLLDISVGVVPKHTILPSWGNHFLHVWRHIWTTPYFYPLDPGNWTIRLQFLEARCCTWWIRPDNIEDYKRLAVACHWPWSYYGSAVCEDYHILDVAHSAEGHRPTLETAES
jgi:hypothetical protein